ncbi:MAG TPA: flagellar basal-body rod protein FlgF [Methylomirabilota bacterium]|jgi:flagellar basal-body rod protein FlgG|nr:flagellar basal-body rod protein FlgF [Methylomirabilota bacterium]
MNAAMYKALSGAIVQTRRLEAVTQDLANVNTAGYKGERLAFREVLEAPRPRKQQSGGQVAVSEQRTDLSPGAIHYTGNPLDLAIMGDGFFTVQTPRGVRYTRQGTFSLSANNTIVMPSGEPLLGEGGPIRVDGSKVEVTAAGVVLVNGEEVDRLKIMRPEDPRRLAREGYAFFQAADADMQPIREAAGVMQGNVEEANVNPVEAMVALIDIQRQYEAYERAMRTLDSVTEKVVNETGRV